MSCRGNGPYCGPEPAAGGPRSRPMAILSRWTETGIAALLLALALRYGIGGVMLGGWAGWVLIALAALIGIWLRLAALKAWSARADLGPGVANVDERRVTYMGPETGGALSLDALRAVDVESGDAPVWILRQVGGPTLRIPAAADGADRLPEALAALPGFSETKALRALGAGGHALHPVWRRAAVGTGVVSIK